MTIQIDTFSNVRGGDSFFKAVGHPFVVPQTATMMAQLRGRVGLYDPLGLLVTFAEFQDFSRLNIAAVFVQKVEDLGRSTLGHQARLIVDIATDPVDVLLVVAFDAQRYIDHIQHLVAPHTRVLSLDAMRLPGEMLTNTRRYLDPLNFATNYALFRDAGGWHTRIVTADYWSGWGSGRLPRIWLRLFDQSGQELVSWFETVSAPGASIVIDSQEVRKRFDLGEFTGSLFMHVIGVAGHDVVKYAMDVYGDDLSRQLSCTHDANAWPSDLFAGLPAPAEGETVILWLQNSHPVTIPPRSVGINLMGSDDAAWIDEPIAPFACYALDVAKLLPEAHWPQQIEIRAGRYFVRPRYEVLRRAGTTRMAHVNVERTDLVADTDLVNHAPYLGKSYILPAPILPVERWRSVLQPNPMSTAMQHLPLEMRLYDANGTEAARHRLGVLPRNMVFALDVTAFMAERGITLASGYGHIELIYDLEQSGGTVDGWLHGLFRYTQISSNHMAETSFGGHIYNMVVTYKKEPQSYAGSPPGLSTRLFLRLADAPLDTFCQLIYPVSQSWHAHSATELQLHDAQGQLLATASLQIPASGSVWWRYHEVFDEALRHRAGNGAYVIIRDSTCRLFGYHGILNGDAAFCIDHMFGF